MAVGYGLLRATPTIVLKNCQKQKQQELTITIRTKYNHAPWKAEGGLASFVNDLEISAFLFISDFQGALVHCITSGVLLTEEGCLCLYPS